MTDQLVEADQHRDVRSEGRRAGGRLGLSWRPRISRWDVPAAMVTWVVALLAGELLVRRADLNPFTVTGAVMPVAVGGAVAGVLLIVLLRWPRSDVLIGIVMGAYAGWVSLVMAQALHGTPFSYGGIEGDEGRLVAQATKYMSSWGATDAFVRHLPTEYPPLFPWVVGHVASIVHRPAWRLVGDAQVVLYSLGLLLGYSLWRRLVRAPIALLIVVLAPVVPSVEHYGDAGKVYEFVVLVVMAPWILATFAGLPRERGGLHWLPAGLIGGLIVLTYPAYFVFALFGVLGLMVLCWRGTNTRRRYALHLVGVAVTATVVASWYVIPFLVQSWTHDGNRLSDLYRTSSIVTAPVPLPFLEATPFGLLCLAGLVGVILYRRSEWWAQPMLLLVVSTYVYRLLFLLILSANDHTGYLEHTDRLTSAVLVAAGIMTFATALSGLRARGLASSRGQREVVALGALAIVVWAAMQTWTLLTPGPRGVLDADGKVGGTNFATYAHIAPLPGGGYPRFAPASLIRKGETFPAFKIQQAVEATLGAGARPECLANLDLLYEYLPYYAYIPHSRLAANTLQRWDDRLASLQTLTRTKNPVDFAAESAHLEFGRIDVFVLREQGARWIWRGHAAPVGDVRLHTRLAFRPRAFSPQFFAISHLPGHTVVAIRLPPR